MRCGKHEYQPGQRCPAKNAKCRLSQNRTFPQSVPEQEESHPESQPCSSPPPQDNDDTHIDENGVRQPNSPPRINMLKVVNHTEANEKV